MAIKVAKVERISEIEVQKLRKILGKTKINRIKTIGANLLEGIIDIEVMVDLPRVILTHSIIHSEALVEGLQVCSKYTQDGDIKGADIDALLEELGDKLAEISLTKNRKIEK